MKTIVITGGPCSGKTSALEALKKQLVHEGVPVVFVAEAGTDLINSGISPASCGSMLPFQIQVARLQLVREAEAWQEAQALGQDALIICDRGICDGKAYLEPADYQRVLDACNLSHEEALGRYDAVLCLESTAHLGAKAYTTANNSARSETVDEAAALDLRTYNAWKEHPHFYFIANESTFDAKLEKLIATLHHVQSIS